ncbi:MAG: hypothetical protein IPJ41_17030 [Phycisphaerales bacterium]|nr:hypothetical protein [Phycisphaerales bacterium]
MACAAASKRPFCSASRSSAASLRSLARSPYRRSVMCMRGLRAGAEADHATPSTSEHVSNVHENQAGSVSQESCGTWSRLWGARYRRLGSDQTSQAVEHEVLEQVAHDDLALPVHRRLVDLEQPVTCLGFMYQIE